MKPISRKDFADELEKGLEAYFRWFSYLWIIILLFGACH